MLNNIYFSNYYKEDSRIHKLNPQIKLIILLITFISLIIANSIHNIILLNLYILTIILYSNISLNLYLKQLLNFKVLIIILIILSLILTRNIYHTIYITIKIIDILILINTLIMTTTPLEINVGLTNILDNRIINTKKLILNITLLVMAMPLIKETKEQIRISKKIRGLRTKEISKKEKIKMILDNLESTYRLTKIKINRISTMLETKNYFYHPSKTKHKKERKTKMDKIVIILTIIILVLVIIY